MADFHRKLERSAIGFMLAIVGVASIGGLVEIAPLFTIGETVEAAPDMRVYTPLEVAGRNIYMREGCYACHSSEYFPPTRARSGPVRLEPHSMGWSYLDSTARE